MLRRSSLPVILAAMAAMAPGAARADWLTYGHDYAHSGRSGEAIRAPLAVKWQFASRPYFGLPQGSPPTVNAGSPIITASTIYFASRDRLYALDRASGEMIWRYPSGDEKADSIRSTPVLSGNTIYFGANDGKLYAVDATTGSQIWTFHTNASIRSHPLILKSSPNDPGLVVFGSDDDVLYAIDAASGELRWKYTEAKDDIATALCYSEPDGMVYFACSDMSIHAVRVATGKRKWVDRTPVAALNVSPVIYENRIWMPSGMSLWSFRLTSGSRAVVTYFGEANQLESDISTTPIITPDPDGPGGASSGLAYFGDKNSNFYCTTLKGQRRWKTHLDGRPAAMPVLAGDTLYVGTEKGFVYALNSKDGTILWSYRWEAPRDYYTLYSYPNISAPLVADGGQLFVLADDGTLTCFTADAIDANAPTISTPKPDRGSVINGSPPVTVTAFVWDVGSGVNPASVTVFLDNQPMPPSVDPYYKRGSGARTGVTYDPAKRVVEFRTTPGRTGERAQPLKDGRHEVKIQAVDWKGNMAELAWTFVVDNTLPVRRTRTPATTQPGAFPGSGGAPGMSGYGPGGSGGFPGGQPGVGSQQRPSSRNTRQPASRRRR